MTENILQVEKLSVNYTVRSGVFNRAVTLRAVNNISFNLQQGQTLGIAGESGSGKSTLARALVGLTPIHQGEIRFVGQLLKDLDQPHRRSIRRDMQLIFQDPLASLNPRMTAGQIIAEPLLSHDSGMKPGDARAKVQEVMERVGLSPSHYNNYPHEFSGGQCQRISIARALILKPKLLICDEPVSSLDVSIQAQVINLLKDLQDELGLSMIFIAHDLSIVRHISQQVLIMYKGEMVEYAATDMVFERPRHSYTKSLLASVPIADPRAARAAASPSDGETPPPFKPPSG
ncbi:MAG: ATP-binding cassette domain-containing protein [Gammaproteobacteria bacterium]|nr:ATP-binding cassette domain-containing protein [Gammaproteobacteria bacterium]